MKYLLLFALAVSIIFICLLPKKNIIHLVKICVLTFLTCYIIDYMIYRFEFLKNVTLNSFSLIFFYFLILALSIIEIISLIITVKKDK